MGKTSRFWILSAAAVLCLTAFDQWTKLLAVRMLKGQQAFVLVDGILEFSYLENRGAAFGTMQGQKAFLVAITVVLVAIVLYFYRKIPRTLRFLPMLCAMVLILAGAAGNFIDRVRLDYVIDFIYFKLIDFPTFNVADCYVVIAVILFAVLILFVYREEELEFLFGRGKKKP